MAQQAFQLNNPAGLYDPAPNAYSHVARLEPGVRLVCLAGQGLPLSRQTGGILPNTASRPRRCVFSARCSVNAQSMGPWCVK
jgi:hypothetical protein